jgi:hypothetical protein
VTRQLLESLGSFRAFVVFAFHKHILSHSGAKLSEGKDHPGANQNHGHEQQRKISGKIHVNGEIEANIPSGVIEQYKAARQENTSRDNWRFLVECLTLIVVTIYAGLTLSLARSSQKSADAAIVASKSAVASYDATVRPYLFMAGISTKVDSKPINLTFNANLKNYGTIPAQAVTYSWVVVANGVSVPISHFPDQPQVLPPGETSSLVGSLGANNAPPIMDGSQPLLIYTAYSYSWRDKQESGCEKFMYSSTVKAFFNLGPTCYPN